MDFIKKFFGHDDIVIGLSELRKREEYVKITIPEKYKKTYITNTAGNYLLI